jgi:undecaprenyl-diphosphatase
MKPLPLVFAVALAAFLWWRRRKLGRLELIGGAVVVAAVLVYGTGLVHPPNLEKAIEDLGTALGPYTYALVGVMAFLETGAFVGLLAPGETFILVGGLVAGQGQISIVALVAIVWTAAVAGDLTSFLLGRRLGRDFMLRHGSRVKITPERLEQVEGFYGRHGGKAVFLGRFVGLIRAVSPFVAGSSRMPLRRFLPYDVLGAGIWGGGLCVLGYVFWQSFDKVATYASRGLLALGSVIALVAGGIAAYRWLREAEHRAEAHAWLHEQAERPLLRPFARVARPVVWRGIVPAWKLLVGPLRFAGGRFTPGDLGLELTTLLAIAAVGGFGFFALGHAVGSGPTRADSRAFSMAADIRTDFVVDLSKVVSALGSLPVVALLVVVAAGVLVSRRHPIEAAALVSAQVLVVIAVHVAKDAYDRPRPPGSLVDTAGLSYPSGHAAYSIAWVAVAVALARGVPRLAGRAAVLVVALTLAAAIGLTRVELRAHYLTDVLGGWGLGAALYALCGVAGLLVGYMRHTARSP